MKQYLIDEIRLEDMGKLKGYLDETFGASGIDRLYWVPLDAAFFNNVQQAHEACAPFFMALELGEDRLAAELLVRTRNRVRCDCIRYADERQRNWLVKTVDAIFDDLEIIT